ncbi:hypothetical protein [Candidatus Mycoplasma haematobovis]|uniref:hypothetical protein n=1 Tax=Candidatus Mycoplasma haematobovis TaxID=432608 RepID=UPI00164F5C51|nr:hypothetical protein [Candidatus Mycoplasma haematobovis]
MSGVPVATYLLIPSAPIEIIESGSEPLPEIKKSNAFWKTSLIKQGYVPVSLGDPFEYFPRITEAFKKAKNIEDGTESSKLRSLCNSLESKDTLSPTEEKDGV